MSEGEKELQSTAISLEKVVSTVDFTSDKPLTAIRKQSVQILRVEASCSLTYIDFWTVIFLD